MPPASIEGIESLCPSLLSSSPLILNSRGYVVVGKRTRNEYTLEEGLIHSTLKRP
jgi:hypothetical protein